MTKADIPAGMKLKEIAGWNQTPSDWERFLDSSPQGCFVAESGGQVVGTATTIVYEGRFAWIGMVLVDPAHRGQGLGTKLLKRTIEFLDSQRVPTIKLDATPQGKPIYEKLGFVPEFEIERRTLIRPFWEATCPPPEEPEEITEIFPLDLEVFGADRSSLLLSLHCDAPQFTQAIRGRGRPIRDAVGRLHFTHAIRQQGAVVGYALGRHGSRADHLGPWVARDESTARELLDAFLRVSPRETVYVDCVRANPWALRLLRNRGFELARPLTRMYRGPNHYPGRFELLCAILGPEFG
jgi:GNAT superfamily N-acetyltransferase